MGTVKNKGGRPRMTESLKVMNNSTSTRIHNDILNEAKELNALFKAGAISLNDIRLFLDNDIKGLLNKRNLQNEITKEEKKT